METLLDGLANAIQLIVTLDDDVVQYALRSLQIALTATLIAAVPGIPLGMLLAQWDFHGKRLVVAVLNTLLAIPTVVVGLFVYSLISRSGPLGSLGLLFTVPGIIVGEVLLILPIIVAFSFTAVSKTAHVVRLTALGLGASRTQALYVVALESRFGILAAIVAAFGRVVGEVGVAMILGGNVDRFTRTLTTATILTTDMGYFELALALGLVLLLLALGINLLFQLVQGEARQE